MKRALAGVSLAVGIAAAFAVDAGTLAFTPSTGITQAGQPNAPVNLGIVFTANNNFSVDALGFYLDPKDSNITGPEQVGLYDSLGNLLASATVSTSGPVVDGYVFQSITPLGLTAGNTYTIDAFTGNNDWEYSSTAQNASSDVTFGLHDYDYTNTLAFPTATASAAGGPAGTYYGPNFEIGGGTPEPAEWLIMSMGIAAIGVALRLRRRSAALMLATS